MSVARPYTQLEDLQRRQSTKCQGNGNQASENDRIILNKLLTNFQDKYGWKDWDVAECVASVIKSGEYCEEKMLWFFKKSAPCRYFVQEDLEKGLDEFYILGAFEQMIDPVKISLGILRTRSPTPQFQSAALCSDKPLVQKPNSDVTIYNGYIVRILAHFNNNTIDDDTADDTTMIQKLSFSKATHIEDVLRKKSLHCESVEWNNSQIPSFAVLRPQQYSIYMDILQKHMTTASNRDWKKAIEVYENTPTPWEILNDNVDELEKIRQIVTENMEGQKNNFFNSAFALNENVDIVFERMPCASSEIKATSWWAAEQSQRSASIPPIFMYEPIVIRGDDGEYFELFRVR